MKILITGGLGNLGLWLTKSLLSKDGYQVHVLGRRERVIIRHPSYRFLQCDITDYKELCHTLTEHYDVCIHTASYNEHFHPDYAKKSLLINAMGTDNLCRALSVHGVGKLIYFSTFHVYGAHSGNVDEHHEISPKNDYGLTHFFAEKYIEKHHVLTGLKYVIFRLTNGYGCPEDINTDKWYLLFNDICRQAYNKQEICLTSDGLAERDFIWLGDVVSVTKEILLNHKLDNMIINLASGQVFSVFQIANMVCDVYECIYGTRPVINRKEPLNIKNLEKPQLQVCNKELKESIDMEYSNEFKSEAKKIFELLENT